MKKGVVFFFSLIAFATSIFSYSNSEPDVYSGVTWLISGEYEKETGFSWWENGVEENETPGVNDYYEHEILVEEYKQALWDSFEFSIKIPVDEISDFDSEDKTYDFSIPSSIGYGFIMNYFSNKDTSQFIAEDVLGSEDFEIGFDENIQKLSDYKNILSLYFSQSPVQPVYETEEETAADEEIETTDSVTDETENDFDYEAEADEQIADYIQIDSESQTESDTEDSGENQSDAEDELENEISEDSQSQIPDYNNAVFTFGFEYMEDNQIKKEISTILLTNYDGRWYVVSVMNNLLSFWSMDIPVDF